MRFIEEWPKVPKPISKRAQLVMDLRVFPKVLKITENMHEPNTIYAANMVGNLPSGAMIYFHHMVEGKELAHYSRCPFKGFGRQFELSLNEIYNYINERKLEICDGRYDGRDV